MNKQHEMVGKIFPTNNGGDCVVLEYIGWDNIIVKFLDEFGMVVKVTKWNLLKGAVRNVYAKSVCGVGFLGEDRHTELSEDVKRKVNKLWQGIMERGYSDRYKEYKPSYKDVYVCEEWHNLQNFTDWVIKQKYFNIGYHLDKDILVKGNKVYGPDTCCFVPHQINTLLTDRARDRGDYPVGVYFREDVNLYSVTLSVSGRQRHVSCHKILEDAVSSYKTAKEAQVKAVAIEWKDKIDGKVYDALMNWTLD